jgi:hypothetical protein
VLATVDPVTELMDRAAERGYLLVSELEELRDPLTQDEGWFEEAVQLAQDRGIPIVDDVAEDRPQVSGHVFPRHQAGVPAAQKEQHGDAKLGQKLDRLGRSLPHLIQIVMALREKGVAFRSLTEQMDTTTAHGELLFGLFGALATSMATTGYATIKEFQKAELVIAPSIKTEGKTYQAAQRVGMGH